jgi:putative endopeptidase
VGYPERWPDHSTLTVRADDALGNLRRLERWTYRNALANLGTPADRKTWWLAPHSPGAVLNFHQNSYNFAAALLQPPKFDASASQAAAYGAIGAIVGHEVSHFVDTLGADHDSAGRKRRWWSEADLANYRNATAPLSAQVAGYRPIEGSLIDGPRTLVENVADLAGLASAFDAYRASLGAAPVDAEQLRGRDREFFIAFARSWRAKYSEEGLRNYLARDHHAPERFRIWTVRNIDAWYDAFDVRPGHALYLEPKARIRIW